MCLGWLCNTQRSSTHKMMLKVFERNGLVLINPVGEKFDPNQVGP